MTGPMPAPIDADQRRQIFDSLDQGVVVQDAGGSIRDWNSAALRLLGLTADQLCRRTPRDARWRMTWDNRAPIESTRDPLETVVEAASEGEPISVIVRTDDDATVWLSIAAHVIGEPGSDAASHIVATIADVTAQRQAEQQNAHYREIIDTLNASHRIVEESPIGMCSVDINGNVLRSNMAFLALGGADTTSILPLFPADDRATLIDAFAWLIDGRTSSVRIESRVKRPTGTSTWCEVTAVAMRQGMPDAAILLLIEDVTERRRRETRLRQLAERDPLTGLHNRRSFVQIVGERLTALARPVRRSATTWTLLLIDLDGFKNVNDTCGHAGGDAVLVAVAAGIRDRTRVADTVGRLGGDEFAVLFESSEGTNGIAIAEQIIERIAEAARSVPGAPPVTASIGIVTLQRGRTAEETLDEADRAMYRAKRAGKSRAVAAS
ncbi:MAG: diguanylate cyclase [Candidatus Elarobacter sp.]